MRHHHPSGVIQEVVEVEQIDRIVGQFSRKRLQSAWYLDSDRLEIVASTLESALPMIDLASRGADFGDCSASPS
jgi:hypothetical protein